MRGNSDGILVVFFGDLEQFQDQEKRQYELLSKIWAQMKHCESTWKLAAKMELQNTNRSSRVTIQLSTKQQSITFNVLLEYLKMVRTICCCSAAKSCLTLCDSMNCSMAGSPIFHCLLEFVQIYVH